MRRQSIWMQSMAIVGFVLALGIATSSSVRAAEKSQAQSQATKRIAVAKRPEGQTLQVAIPAKRSKPRRLLPSQIDPA